MLECAPTVPIVIPLSQPYRGIFTIPYSGYIDYPLTTDSLAVNTVPPRKVHGDGRSPPLTDIPLSPPPLQRRDCPLEWKVELTAIRDAISVLLHWQGGFEIFRELRPLTLFFWFVEFEIFPEF